MEEIEKIAIMKKLFEAQELLEEILDMMDLIDTDEYKEV